MHPAQLTAAIATAVAVLLWAERRGARGTIWIAKPIASLGFVSVALLGRGLGHDAAFGAALLAGLALCACGDVLLIPRSQGKWFLLGLGSFMLGHAAFMIGFVMRGIALGAFGIGFGGMVAVGLITLRWLLPKLSPDMRVPVTVYIAVIVLMVASAVGTSAAHSDLRLAAGAIAFAASDISVARERFVRASFANLLWGLPLYYAAQITLAFAASS
jgi:uncharacterized membrane protein YhhN